MVGLRITKSWICSVIQRRFKEGIWYKKLVHRKYYKIPAIPAILLAVWRPMWVVCRQQTRWHWQCWTPEACHMLHLTSLPPEGLAASTTTEWYMKHSWVKTQKSLEKCMSINHQYCIALSKDTAVVSRLSVKSNCMIYLDSPVKDANKWKRCIWILVWTYQWLSARQRHLQC